MTEYDSHAMSVMGFIILFHERYKVPQSLSMQDGTLPISMSHTYELTGHDHCLGNTVGIISFTECFFMFLCFMECSL